MELIRKLADPEYVVKFQRLCGITADNGGNQCAGEGVTGGLADETYLYHVNGYAPIKNGRNLRKHIQCEYKKLIKDDYGNNNVTENGRCKNTVHDDHAVGAGIIQAGSTAKNRTANKEKYEPQQRPKFRITNKPLHVLFKSAAFLGSEDFFLIFFPFCFWNIDYALTRQTTLIWCMCMYLGQAFKDYFQWPRPSTPVVQLESAFLQEFSMPSTHAMAGTAIPMVMAYLVSERYEVPFMLAFGVALIWCLAVCLSRLYMGVHTVLDLLAGVVFAIAIIFVMVPYLDNIDHYIQRHPFSPLCTLLTGLVLCFICYPNNKHANAAKENAIQIVACTVGMAFAVWINFQYDIIMSPMQETTRHALTAPAFKTVVVSLIRSVIGVIIVMLTRAAMKWLSVRVASYMIGLDKPDAKHPGVGSSYKFVTFFTLGLVITWLIPLIHRVMGLGRRGFQTGVL